MIDEKTYETILDVLPIVTVDVIPFNEELTQILLFKRVNKPVQNQYYSPGGRLLKNEGLAQGALRKFRSELGIDINEDELIPGGVMNEIWHESVFTSINYHTVNIFFGYLLKKSQLSQLVLDNQHCQYRWFDIEDPDIHPNIKHRVDVLTKKSDNIIK